MVLWKLYFRKENRQSPPWKLWQYLKILNFHKKPNVVFPYWKFVLNSCWCKQSKQTLNKKNKNKNVMNNSCRDSRLGIMSQGMPVPQSLWVPKEINYTFGPSSLGSSVVFLVHPVWFAVFDLYHLKDLAFIALLEHTVQCSWLSILRKQAIKLIPVFETTKMHLQDKWVQALPHLESCS